MPQIEIIPYQTRWLEEFHSLGAELRAALGSTVQIHHIGSTSVPGLAAKDVLDIQVSLFDLEHPDLRPALEDCGFVWRDIQTDHTPPGMVVAAHDLERVYKASRQHYKTFLCITPFNNLENKSTSLENPTQ
jgi:GrpB-like predicted nucleotidyltransferase (UPF0157 family)